MSSRRISLRTILIGTFLCLSVLPVTLVTFFSVNWFKQAMNFELNQRLKTQGRELQDFWDELDRNLVRESGVQIQDKNLVFDLLAGETGKVRQRLNSWLQNSTSKLVKLYDRDGRLIVDLEKDSTNQIESRTNLENKAQLAPSLIEKASSSGVFKIVDFTDQIDLVSITAIKATGGHDVGFMEKLIRVDGSMVQQIRNRFNVEVVFLDSDRKKMMASLNMDRDSQQKIKNHAESPSDSVFSLQLPSGPYAFASYPLHWGDAPVTLYLGANTESSIRLVDKVSQTFGTVLFVVVLALVLLAFIASRIVFRPVADLLNAIKSMQSSGRIEGRLKDNRTELGLLAESFNQMAEKIESSQSELRANINKLEDANREIKSAQSQLVQSAKMASLGQLVAGVAHELNNPIGFIYANVHHLRQYSNDLMEILADIEEKKLSVADAKAKHDFDFLQKDLPRLLQACEDGAQRTRDIVVGLRNFSRLDEAEIKDVDIHEGLENTLRLISGELKNRIKVRKRFADLPKISCYPSQLNQVFMNILTNAAQAIEGEGEITIETAIENSDVRISISDTGHGMGPEVVEKVFDPFFTTKSENRGTGLGMSISFGIIQKHGGRIGVKSSLGKGSTFSIYLPMKTALQV